MSADVDLIGGLTAALGQAELRSVAESAHEALRLMYAGPEDRIRMLGVSRLRTLLVLTGQPLARRIRVGNAMALKLL